MQRADLDIRFPQRPTSTRTPSKPDSRKIQINDLVVEGLRNIHFPHKAYVELVIGEQKRVTSKISRKRNVATVRWPDQYSLPGTDSSTLEIRVYDRGTCRKYQFVGGVRESVETLCKLGRDNGITLALGPLDIPVGNIQGRIMFRIVSQSSDESPDILRMRDNVGQANLGLGKLDGTPAILAPAGHVIDLQDHVANYAGSVAAYLEPVLQRSKTFLELTNSLGDRLAEVHPYAKAAWIVLSFAYKTALAQKGRDKAMKTLAGAMTDVYDFLSEAEQIKQFEFQAKILTLMMRQTEECAYFIQEYAATEGFANRAVKHLFTSVDDRITRYQAQFEDLRKAFQGRAVLQTEIVVTRIWDIVTDTASAVDLNDLPYAEGARFSETSCCLEGTREKFLETIQVTLSGPADGESPRIILVTAVAGYGKSAVANTIAKRFDERARLASSFFFDRNDGNRNRIDNVFPTVARDIADGNPEIKERLWASIKDNRSLRKITDVRTQFHQFILGPTQRLTIVGPVITVFDGLDECASPVSRRHLLNVLAEEFPKLAPNFRLLVTARPEEDIVRSLASLPFVRHIRMEDYIEHQSNTSDLSAYVVKELSSIETELETGWPQMAWRDELVKKADGLFIWMSTACLFIQNEGKGATDHSKRLRLVLSEGEHSALGPLDKLYLRVLRDAFDEGDADSMKRFKAVIGKTLAAKIPLSCNAICDILEAEGLMSDPQSLVKSVVQYLGSVLIGVAEWDRPLQILHLSFKDFLTDPSRSQNFFIDVHQETNSMAIICLDIINQHLKRDMISMGDSTEQNPDIQQIQTRMEKFEVVRYVCRYWVDHVIDSDTCDNPLYNRLLAFFTHDALHWIEGMSLTGQLEYGIGSLDQLGNWLNRQTHHDIGPITDLILDLKRLLLAFGSLIPSRALQVYSSMVFVPQKTALFTRYSSEDPQAWRILNARPNWSPLISTLRGHTDNVIAVCYSPDGTRLASYSDDNTVRIWDARTGNAIGNAMTGHTDNIDSIIFSPDGTRLASCSRDRTVRLWNAHTGHAIRDPLIGHTHWVKSICFSSNGNRLASCSWDSTVRLWDAHTGHAIGDPMPGHTDFIDSICFSPDGALFVSYSYDNAVRLWDAHTGRAISGNITTHEQHITSICFSPDGTRLASCSHDTVRLFDVHTGHAIGDTMKGHTSTVSSVIFSPDGTHLASCCDNTVRVWDAHTGRAVGDPITGHTHSVISIHFSPDGTRLASYSEDKTIRLWEVPSCRAIGNAMADHIHRVRTICFSPDATRLASSSSDGTVRLWNAHTSHAIGGAMTGHTDGVRSICFSPDGARLASCSDDRTVRLWDAKSGHVAQDVMPHHTQAVQYICFSSDGAFLASCSQNTLGFWNTHTGQGIGDLVAAHTKPIISICFSPDGTRLASHSYDNTLRLWDPHTGHVIGDAMTGHTDFVTSISFSPDGTRLASCSHDNTVRLWDAQTGNAIGDPMIGHTDSVVSVCFSPNGNLLASGSNDATVRLWDAHTGRAVGDPMRGHTEGVDSICFSPHGTRLASCSWDTTVRLWDVRTGHAIGDAMTGHTDWVRSVCFSPDGTCLASCSNDQTVRLWDGHTGLAIGDAMVGHTSSVDYLCFSPDGARLASFSSNENLIWDTHSCRPVNAAAEGGVDHWRSVVNAIIDTEGWLCLHGRRELWIPEEYGRDLSPVEGVRKVGDSTTVCIGGSTGTVTFLRLPDRTYITPFDT